MANIPTPVFIIYKKYYLSSSLLQTLEHYREDNLGSLYPQSTYVFHQCYDITKKNMRLTLRRGLHFEEDKCSINIQKMCCLFVSTKTL
jgi:hypothetical protein